MGRFRKPSLTLLAELDAQYRRQGQQPQVQSGKRTLGLAIIVAGERFIIDTTTLIEVVRLDKQRKLSPIPTERCWHKGLMSIRGQLVNIIDLAAYLMEKTTEIGPKTRIIIVGREQFLSGFLVDECLGLIQTENDQTLKTIDKALNGRLAFACRQTYELDKENWTMLDLSRLYADPEFTQVTAS